MFKIAENDAYATVMIEPSGFFAKRMRHASTPPGLKRFLEQANHLVDSFLDQQEHTEKHTRLEVTDEEQTRQDDEHTCKHKTADQEQGVHVTGDPHR